MDNNIEQSIDASRKAFIKAFQMQHGGKKVLKHIGQINEQDLPADCQEFHKSKVKGDEICIEYHHFNVAQGPKKGMQVLGQWRLRPFEASI